MAGVPTAAIRDALHHDAIVRAIPNTPAQVGEGMTVWTATDAVPEAAREEVRGILAVLGQELYVGDEKYVDMAAPLGPVRHVAQRRVIQPILGSAKYAQVTGKHPADLRNQVPSPAGTTTEGLRALEKAGLRLAFIEAVQAAYDKAPRLGG